MNEYPENVRCNPLVFVNEPQLTKLEQFAAAALKGMLARREFHGSFAEYAKMSFEFAQAMIDESKKQD